MSYLFIYFYMKIIFLLNVFELNLYFVVLLCKFGNKIRNRFDK